MGEYEMLCKQCKTNMIYFRKEPVQGWSCPNCGWGMVTSYIDPIYEDTTEYSIYIKEGIEVDADNIKIIAKIAGVNYLAARKLLLKNNVCILKANAPEVKEVIALLEDAKIDFEVKPEFLIL